MTATSVDRGRLPAAENPERERIVAEFAALWTHDVATLYGQKFLGVPTLQHPFDAWVTQEIICETCPERIVECGAFRGGSALMWAMLLEHVSDGRVVSIDVRDNVGEAARSPLWGRVDFLHGSTVDQGVVDAVARLVDGHRTMVILDSAHDAEHVSRELEAYAGFVSEGCYLVVQDGFVNGHPLVPEHGPGPWEATQAFLERDRRFVVDERRERMLFTFNPSGFLRRV